MLSRRTVTLFGSGLVFAAVSAALFILPGWEAVFFPAYGMIFLWNDMRGEEETHILFLFLMLVAAFLFSARLDGTAAYIGIGLEIVGLALLSFGLGLHRGHLAGETFRIGGALEKFDMKILDAEREEKFYQAYEASALHQVSLRRDLTQAAKSLGTTMDAQEVKLRLTGILQGRYKGSRVRILASQPDDPIAQYAIKSRTPVLVKDMSKEIRFGPRQSDPGFRSALVVPLTVMKKPYGFVRLDSEKTALYNNDDLKTVDLIATLASLSLENIQLYQDVKNLAAHDSLTHLATQRTFRQRLKDELLRAGRAQTPLSMVMIDVDHFKRYNDTYGHQAGDEVLRSVSRILVNYIRQVDCAARYGGEEFALILPSVDLAQAVEATERIRKAVEAEPFMFEGQRSRVTISAGVSSFPADATSQSQLIRIADERLYRSKDEGRNRVTG